MIGFKELEKGYLNHDSRYICLDKELHSNGISYRNFLKLRFESINLAHIKEVYTHNGWYILWYLMINAHQGQRIKTTLKLIEEDVKGLTDKQIKKILLNLEKVGVIKLSCIKDIRTATPLTIHILYNNDTYYNEIKLPRTNDKSKNGYKAIPLEYIKIVFPTLDAESFTTYTVLYSTFNYFCIKENDDSSFELNSFQHTRYSFITIRQIEEKTGISRTRISNRLKDLEANKYNLIKIKNDNFSTTYWDESEGKQKIKKSNNTYEVGILTRIEYLYHHIWKIDDVREKQTIDFIKRNGFEKIAKGNNYKLLIPKDYINYYCKDKMVFYEKLLKNKENNDVRERYISMEKKLNQ